MKKYFDRLTETILQWIRNEQEHDTFSNTFDISVLIIYIHKFTIFNWLDCIDHKN